MRNLKSSKLREEGNLPRNFLILVGLESRLSQVLIQNVGFIKQIKSEELFVSCVIMLSRDYSILNNKKDQLRLELFVLLMGPMFK